MAGPAGPTGATGPCSDIDAYAPSTTEDFQAVLTGGKTYVGKATSLGGTIVWQDLTNTTATAGDPANPNYPAGVCGIAIEARGNDAYVKAVTVNGTVWQTHGDIQGNTFVWDEAWVQQTTPTPVALRNKKFATAVKPAAGPKGAASPKAAPKGMKRP
ncbi:hypothetical protein ACIA6C_03745 [Streptomyces sp. NPDC051578]|uniref:hypothetical protein n=1 Tax=Streptomyces sp. NPDC051578 TaxID=3365662 RepID=UPI0037A0BA7F